MKRYLISIIILTVTALWLNNTSLFVDTSAHETKLIAHRGVHQTYAGEDLSNDACTAHPIAEASHSYIENTLPSIRAAFEYGADIVEFDVHLTRDTVFAVFHDWTLDCRTNGTGVTHKQSWAELAQLDIGYNYSRDGTTFPIRGLGVGLMPRLEDVAALANRGRFLINFKSDREQEGTAMVDFLDQHPSFKDQVWGIYGGQRPSQIATQGTDIYWFSAGSFKRCAKDYMLLGWSGYVPQSCRNTVIAVPQNYAWLVWGYPHRFTKRLARHDSAVILIGPLDGSDHTRGIDTEDMLSRVPTQFDGYIWTNRIEVVGPLMNNQN